MKLEPLEELKALQESGDWLYKATDDPEIKKRINLVMHVITEATVEAMGGEPESDRYIIQAIKWVREELERLLVQEGAMPPVSEVQRMTMPYIDKEGGSVEVDMSCINTIGDKYKK